jgi:cytochrome c-type biogenesis protein CcmF
MLVNLGGFTLLIATILSLYAVGTAFYGACRSRFLWVLSARNAMFITFPVLTISVISMIILLVGNHYEVSYVSSVTSNTMPAYLKITALWGGQEGSLLFWSWLLAALASVVTLRNWKRDNELLPWVIIVISITLLFFLLLLMFFENPFQKLWVTFSGQIVESFFKPGNARLYIPKDGMGLNPLLRHPGMILHPPMLYLGFVSFVVPYAFAIGALMIGRAHV